MTLEEILQEARACRVCEDYLPHAPRPVLRAARGARLLIIGQAPGRRVHESGIPWNDPSGDRLRTWLAMSREDFYDESRVAIVPMGFCYPGTVDGADLPPRPECAPLWQARVRAQLPEIGITLLIGYYSQAFHLGLHRRKGMTETVRNFQANLPEFLPLPHPSWRNTAWLRRNVWFENELLPVLRARVRGLMKGSGGG